MAKVAAAPAAHSRSHQQLQQLYGLLDQLFGSTWRQHRVEERAQAPSTTSSRNSTGPAEGESPEQAAARAPEACCTEHSDAPLADLVQQAQALHMIFVAGAGQYEGEWLASKLRVAVPGGVLLVLPHSVFAGCGCNRASCAECRATRHCFYSGPLIERLIGVGVVRRQSDGKVLTADEAVAEIQQHLPLHLPQAALAPPWLPESELPDWRPWEGGASERGRAGGKKAGPAAYEQGKGFHAASREQRTAWAEANGKKGGEAKAHNKEMNDFVRAQCRDEPLWKDWVWRDLVHVLRQGWAQIIGRELTKKESKAVHECVRQCRGRSKRG